MDELTRLLDACRQTPGLVAGVPAGTYWTAVVLLVFDTAFRAGATFKLKWTHVNWDAGTIFAPAEIQKDREDQVKKLHPQTLESLRRIILPKRELIFPEDTMSSRYNRFRSILKRAKLPHGRSDLFHKIRRTTATQAARFFGTAMASDYLGHSTQAITKKSYLDPTQLPEQDLLACLPRPAEGSDDDKLLSLPVATLIVEYGGWLQGAGKDPHESASVLFRLRTIAQKCHFQRAGDIAPEPFIQLSGVMLLDGAAAETICSYRQALVRFAGWIVESKGSTTNLLATQHTLFRRSAGDGLDSGPADAADAA